MLQQQYQSTQLRNHLEIVSRQPLSVLAYRSVAIGNPTNSEIQTLLQAAQSRNRAESLTGVLIYDKGTYFQWLEGPAPALDRVWDSILHDPRHRDIRVLRQEPISERVFKDWDLRVAMGSQVNVEAAVAAMNSPAALRRVIGRPKTLLDLSLEDVFSTIVIPRLREVHGGDSLPSISRQSTATIWHAELNSGEKLARRLLGKGVAGSRRYVNALLDQGANFAGLYQEVFEPAQRFLGKMWEAEQCDDFHLALALARLQMELRRINAFVPTVSAFKPEHSVLLCSQPHELHYAGLVMSSEVFYRNGWAVDCEYPADDGSLNSLVQDRWFDVLKLSQSGSLRRDGRLAELRTTIDSARSASLNPSLIVMVDGRTFVERPLVYQAVHANGMSASVLEGVLVAERLLVASRSLNALCQVSAT